MAKILRASNDFYLAISLKIQGRHSRHLALGLVGGAAALLAMAVRWALQSSSFQP